MSQGRTGAIVVAATLSALAMAQPARAEERRTLLSWRSDNSLKQRDADAALRAALRISLTDAARALSTPDAFGPEQKRRIGLPEALAAMRGDWNAIGRSGALPRLEDAMNRAAAAVAGPSSPVLLEAAAEVNFYDSVAVVMSGDQAASRFFAMRARAALELRLRPILEQALAGSGAFQALAEAAQAAGQPAKAASYRDLVVQRTMAGLLDAIFTETGAIESQVRADPFGRGSPVLEQVFSRGPQTAAAFRGG